MKIKIKKKEFEKMVLSETVKVFDPSNTPMLEAITLLGDLYKKSKGNDKLVFEQIFEHIEKELMLENTKLKDLFNE